MTLINLLSWTTQVLAIATIGALLPFVLRLRHPRSHLAYCYALLVTSLVLPFIQTWQHPVIPSRTGSPVTLSAVVTPATDVPIQTAWTWERIVLWTLIAGVVIRLGWFVVGMWQIRRYRKSAKTLFPVPESVTSARELAGEDAEVCVSTNDVGPVTFGFRRPIILLPESFLALSNDAQCAIVCHELLHVKRRDWLVTVVEELVGAALWFHPAVWWLLNQTKLAREQVVDAEVVRLTDAPEPYIGALLTMSGADPSHGFISAPGFLRKRHLTLRMRSLLMEVPMSRLRLLFSYVSMTCVLVAAGWLALSAFPLIGQPQIQEGLVMDGAGISVDPGGGVLHRTPIIYPGDAQQNHIQGTVVVGLTLNAKGEVIDAHVVSGPDELRKDVLQSVLQWRYVANVSTRTIQARIDFQAPPETKQYKDSITFYPGDIPLGTIDVSDLPEPLRAAVSKRVQPFIGRPFTDSLRREIETAAHSVDAESQVGLDLDSQLGLLRGGVTQDGKQILKFVIIPSPSPQQSSNPVFTLRTEVPSQASSQESDLARKLREQMPDREPSVIAEDEKAAYQKLTTDEERQHFIEQFWLRREPSVKTNLALVAPQEALRVGGGISAPRIISKVNPQYSDEARAARFQGTVLLEVIVKNDGTVQVVRVVRGLGFGLDEQAIEAIQQWIFEPAKQNGIPIAVSLNIEVNFNLN